MKQSQQVLEWQHEAEAGCLRSVVLRALELRTHAPVPPDLAEAVARLTNLDELSRWFDAALTADSLDAFRLAIGRPAPPPANGPAGG
jgi:hypothetical protein